MLLPGAYRSLLRPSSPISAKASTVRPYSLDHITLITCSLAKGTYCSPSAFTFVKMLSSFSRNLTSFQRTRQNALRFVIRAKPEPLNRYRAASLDREYCETVFQPTLSRHSRLRSLCKAYSPALFQSIFSGSPLESPLTLPAFRETSFAFGVRLKNFAKRNFLWR